jgi:lysyl-tRNA synthetase class II
VKPKLRIIIIYPRRGEQLTLSRRSPNQAHEPPGSHAPHIVVVSSRWPWGGFLIRLYLRESASKFREGWTQVKHSFVILICGIKVSKLWTGRSNNFVTVSICSRVVPLTENSKTPFILEDQPGRMQPYIQKKEIYRRRLAGCTNILPFFETPPARQLLNSDYLPRT